MVFNPEESIDLHGFTAAFIQYAYARMSSILRKEHAAGSDADSQPTGDSLLPLERAMIIALEKYPATIGQAGVEMNPSVIAGYAFTLAKTFNSFYAEHSIANAATAEKKWLRLQICRLTATVLRSSMGLMGIRVPERM